MLLSSLLISFFGCGTVEESAESGSANQTNPGVTVSLGSRAESDNDAAKTDSEELNSDADDVSLLLRSIQDLREHRLPKDAEKARQQNRIRNERIVAVATDAIRLCLDNPARKQYFDKAVAELLESRLQLAVDGSSADVDQLYEDVKALSDSAPHSDAAAEGMYTLARFAHIMAKSNGNQDIRWYENFSRWSREFAGRFAGQKPRATALLLGAGRSCEIHAYDLQPADARRMFTEARLCYTDLVDHYPDSASAGDAAAAIRRMSLPGHQLSQFGGPTADGKFINRDYFTGVVTVVYFWDSVNDEFSEKLLPLLQQAAKAGGTRLQFVGVNLDKDTIVMQKFIDRYSPPGTQIVFRDDKLRGWNSPLVRFWGIVRSPSVWLVDKDGTVRTVDAGYRNVVAEMKSIFAMDAG